MAEPNVDVLSVNSPRGLLPTLPVTVAGTSRTLYYGGSYLSDYPYAVEFVRDGTSVNDQIADAYEEAGLSGQVPQLLATLPLQSGWLGLKAGAASGL